MHEWQSSPTQGWAQQDESQGRHAVGFQREQHNRPQTHITLLAPSLYTCLGGDVQLMCHVLFRGAPHDATAGGAQQRQ